MQQRYSIVRELGRGSFGVVNLVRRRADGRLFAAKEISSEGNATAQLHEAELMNLPQHPSIVALEEIVRTRCTVILILEYVAGGALSRKVFSSGENTREIDVVRWITQLCSALSVVHAQGIVHRDIKLDNILLVGKDESSCVKLSDFGAAKCLLRCGEEGVATTFTGTPQYMAPEICEGRPYNTKSDIFSLGVCIFEICSKRCPFQGSNVLAVARQILEVTPPRLPSYYSDGLNYITQQMLIKSPDLRPSVSEVIQLLKRYQRDKGHCSFAQTFSSMQVIGSVPVSPSNRDHDHLESTGGDISLEERQRIFREARLAAIENRKRARERPSSGGEVVDRTPEPHAEACVCDGESPSANELRSSRNASVPFAEELNRDMPGLLAQNRARGFLIGLSSPPCAPRSGIDAPAKQAQDSPTSVRSVHPATDNVQTKDEFREEQNVEGKETDQACASSVLPVTGEAVAMEELPSEEFSSMPPKVLQWIPLKRKEENISFEGTKVDEHQRRMVPSCTTHSVTTVPPVCRNCTGNAVSYCNECSAALCSGCDSNIHSFAVLANHSRFCLALHSTHCDASAQTADLGASFSPGQPNDGCCCVVS